MPEFAIAELSEPRALSRIGIGLDEHLAGPAGRVPGDDGELGRLIADLSRAIVTIADEVGRGALAGAYGKLASTNVQGEVQAALDVASNDAVIKETTLGGLVAGLVSEELTGVHVPVPAPTRAKYLVAVDPLDGSSNLETNVPVGTIFSIMRNPEPGRAPGVVDFLQPGTDQVCSGFALYGAATILVLTTGRGVDAFTYDRDRKEFVLTHPGMRIPEHAREFAINSSNDRFWAPAVRRYVSECLAGRSGPRGVDYNMRWVASLVVETFRILTRGGVFLYPADNRPGAGSGRLRLLYECNPISFIIEQAGGAASTGAGRVLEVEPAGLHQRVPFVFGSRAEVELVEQYYRAAAAPRARQADFALFNSRTLLKRR
jgi:fructose-1,6-bisphosphatase